VGEGVKGNAGNSNVPECDGEGVKGDAELSRDRDRTQTML